MNHLFHQVESLQSARCSQASLTTTHLHPLVVLELVRMDQQRLLTVLLLDIGIARIDRQIENVIRAARERVVRTRGGKVRLTLV